MYALNNGNANVRIYFAFAYISNIFIRFSAIFCDNLIRISIDLEETRIFYNIQNVYYHYVFFPFYYRKSVQYDFFNNSLIHIYGQ